MLAAARAIGTSEFSNVAVDTQSFRFAQLKSWKSADFLPGAVKYGDLPTLLALSAPEKIWIGGDEEIPAIVKSAYDAAGATDKVASGGARLDTTSAAIDWLLQQQ